MIHQLEGITGVILKEDFFEMLKLEHIGKIYSDSTEALRDITFQCKGGDSIGVIGPNGSGKSTLLSILSKEIKPTAGTLYHDFDDFTIAQQNYGLYDFLPVKDHLVLFSKLTDLEKSDFRVKDVISIFGLKNFLNKKIMRLSVGQRKRVQLALTMLKPADLYILDEPTVGLDYDWRMNVTSFLEDRIISDHSKCLFYATHYLHEIERICNKVVVLMEGRLIYFDRLENIISGLYQNKKLIIPTEQLAASVKNEIQQYAKIGPKSYYESTFYVNDEEIKKIINHMNISNIMYRIDNIDIEDVFYQLKYYV